MIPMVDFFYENIYLIPTRLSGFHPSLCIIAYKNILQCKILKMGVNVKTIISQSLIILTDMWHFLDNMLYKILHFLFRKTLFICPQKDMYFYVKMNSFSRLICRVLSVIDI